MLLLRIGVKSIIKDCTVLTTHFLFIPSCSFCSASAPSSHSGRRGHHGEDHALWPLWAAGHHHRGGKWDASCARPYPGHLQRRSDCSWWKTSAWRHDPQGVWGRVRENVKELMRWGGGLKLHHCTVGVNTRLARGRVDAVMCLAICLAKASAIWPKIKTLSVSVYIFSSVWLEHSAVALFNT